MQRKVNVWFYRNSNVWKNINLNVLRRILLFQNSFLSVLIIWIVLLGPLGRQFKCHQEKKNKTSTNHPKDKKEKLKRVSVWEQSRNTEIMLNFGNSIGSVCLVLGYAQLGRWQQCQLGKSVSLVVRQHGKRASSVVRQWCQIMRLL